jgi:hypothetical protein
MWDVLGCSSVGDGVCLVASLKMAIFLATSDAAYSIIQAGFSFVFRSIKAHIAKMDLNSAQTYSDDWRLNITF